MTINPTRNLLGREFGNEEDRAVGYHLQANHYPPIHADFYPGVRAAIRLARQAVEADQIGDREDADRLWNMKIRLPNGATPTVASAVDQCHLDCFLHDYAEEWV